MIFLGKILPFLFLLISHRQIKACSSCDSSKSVLLDSLLPSSGSYTPFIIQMPADCSSDETDLEDPSFDTDTKSIDLDDILEMIDSDILPEEIALAKTDVLRFMLESKLDFSDLLRPLMRYSHLQPIDFIIAGLSRVRDSLRRFCHVHKAIDKLISYLLARKHISGYSGEIELYDSPNPGYASYLRNYPSLVQNFFFFNDRETVKERKIYSLMNYLLDRLPQTEAKELEELEKSAEDLDIEDVSEITTPIPVIVSQTTGHITTLSPSLPPTTQPPPLPPTTQPPPPPFIHLIDLLPKPSNDMEISYYNSITKFLSRTDLQKLLGKNFSITSYKTDTDLLVALLAKAIVLRLDAEMVAAIKYYLEYEVALARIQLKTQKKIEKQFDLSGIFLDVFNLSRLSDNERGAFDAFFHYILELDSSKIHNFDTWTDAKTRGEFMQLLFSYFKKQEFVPKDIKLAIEILYPIIKMDGTGATPP